MSTESTGPAPRRQRGARRLVVGGLMVVVACLALAWFLNPGGIFRGRFVPAALSFDDSSDGLRETVVVPTLDTPIPEGKSAIWCAAIQLAWNRLKDDVVKEPIRLQGAEEVAARLNQATSSEADLSPDEYFAAAGLAGSGIAEHIRREMGRRFPHVPVGDVGEPAAGAIAYAYLQTSIRFKTPFYERDSPLTFKSSRGKESGVASFGVFGHEHLAPRDQVNVLYATPYEKVWKKEANEFVLDLDVNSTPNQIVLARLEAPSTLQAALTRIRQLTVKSEVPGRASGLQQHDTLMVPSMNWRVSHEFREMEGKSFQNPALAGMHIDSVIQKMQFRLDRSGVELAAEARMTYKSMPRAYHFDHPFLLYVKKRTAQHPFFVMWVDNAELLQKR